MLTSLINYILFLSKATNAHGVHSPFVYHYLTKALYAPSNKKHNKVDHIVFQTLQYFKPTLVHFKMKNATLKQKVNSWYAPNSNNNTNSPYEVIIASPNEVLTMLEKDTNCHNHTLFIVPRPCKDHASKQAWQTACLQPQFHVSIDLYHVGVLFLRKEQAKQHFYLRA